MSDTERIAAIRRRAETATAGAWGWHYYDGYTALSAFEPPGGGEGINPVLSVAERDMDDLVDYVQVTRSDAEFIAHAREDIPWLLDALTKAEERTARVQALLDDMRGAHWEGALTPPPTTSHPVPAPLANCRPRRRHAT